MSTVLSKKKVLSVVVGIIALLVVAVGTVVVLNKLHIESSGKTDKSTNNQLSTTDIISGLQSNVPPALASSLPQVAEADQFKIAVKLSDKPVNVAVPVSDVIVFTPKEKTGAPNRAAVLADSKQYFESKGLTETATTSISATYQNQASLCQMQIQTGGVGAVVYGCVTSDAAQREYSTVSELVKLYNQSHASSTINEAALTSVERTTAHEGTVEGATLSLLSGSTEAPAGKVLLFGAINNKWEFVADLTTGKSNGKTNVPEGSEAAIKDGKWNGVLAGLVGLE